MMSRGRPGKFDYEFLEIAYKLKAEKDRWEKFDRDLEALKEMEFNVRIDSEEKIQKMLKIAMENRGIKNKALSQAVKKPAGNVSRLLNSSNMQVKTLLQLCEALGLKLYIKGCFHSNK